MGQRGYTTVYVNTVNGEEPTYERVDHPDGYFGSSITNVTKVNGRMFMMEGNDTLYDSGDEGMTIRVRGNTSAVLFLKKPYKIKLNKKADLLGGQK